MPYGTVRRMTIRHRTDVPVERLGAVVGGTLAAVGGLHVYWAVGGRWPADSDAGLAETVVGSAGTALPPAPLTALVGGALVTAGALVAERAGLLRTPLPDVVKATATPTLAGVLLVRGVGGLGYALATRLPSRYARLDAAIYSPLCLALGLGAARVWRAGA